MRDHDYPEIEPGDIRKGDLIRVEDPREGASAIALEYVAARDGEALWSRIADRRLYLMDRPKPPVMVPAEAIDALREAQEKAFAKLGDEAKNDIRREAIDAFIDAVDEANGADQ